MPTTPVSVSVGVQGTTNTTVYTVPVGKTAIVKAVSTVSANAGNNATTISKFSNNQNFPIVYNQFNNAVQATGGTEVQNVNQLNAPLTMVAGEELKCYVNNSSVYNFPSVSSAMSITAADGTTANILDIKYGNGIYMAVGSSGTGIYVATSTDAVTWTQRTQPNGLGSVMNRLEYANGVWVGATYNLLGSIFYSTDNGVTWAYATGVSAIQPRGLFAGNNTFVINAINGTVYYSTNGVTWTGSNSLYDILNPAGLYPINVAYTGTHWVASTTYGNYATTDFVTWKGFGCCDGNRGQTTGATAYNDMSYSPLYGKYYTSRSTSGVPNLFSSSTGIVWDQQTITGGGNTVGRVCVAGSNPVIIVAPNSSVSGRWYSSNGTTFSYGIDAQSAYGKVWGLDNGYFLTFRNNSDSTCYLSANPITGPVTASGGDGGTRTPRSAAADPITGKWCAIMKDADSNRWATIGGTSGSNMGAEYFPGFNIDSTNGNPMAVTWSAADSAFYAVSDSGKVYRATSYNSSWTQLSVTLPANYNTNTVWAIKVIGTRIMVFMGQNTTYAYYYFLGSTLNGGATFTAINLASRYSTSNWRPNYVTGSAYYTVGDTLIASDGTNAVYVNGMGQVSAINVTANPAALISPPTSFGVSQTQGSFGFAYGGMYQNNSTTITGAYYSTNLSTTWGDYCGNTQFTLQYSETGSANKVAYVGGRYYFNAFSIQGEMYNGTTPSSLTGASTGSSFAGISTVSPSLGWALDGTNLVGVNNRINGFMKTSTPANFLYAGTITASIVEIS